MALQHDYFLQVTKRKYNSSWYFSECHRCLFRCLHCLIQQQKIYVPSTLLKNCLTFNCLTLANSQRFASSGFVWRYSQTYIVKDRVEECKSVRSKVVSIEGRFDRQKSIRSKTRVSSIEDCNYCLSVLNLLFIKSYPFGKTNFLFKVYGQMRG